jgi:hypothetical protein
MALPWLPPLVLLNSYNGNWDSYIEAVYNLFCRDFVSSLPSYQGRRLALKRHPVSLGKEATFWHMVSTGDVEEDRIPDLRRCERICWPRKIIENDTHSDLKCWVEMRGKEPRIHLWCEAEGYLVVLADRGKFLLPWTAYHVEYKHEIQKLNKRWLRHSGKKCS